MTYPPKTGIGQLNGRKLESGCIYPAEFGSSSGNLKLEEGPFLAGNLEAVKTK